MEAGTLSGNSPDAGFALAVDAFGNAYVAGQTGSPNFPVTANAFQRARGGLADAFVLKLNATGSALVYATRLGGKGHDHAASIAIDALGNAYITGQTYSANFPISATAFQKNIVGTKAVFVAKLNPDATALLYSTYLAGSGTSYGVTDLGDVTYGPGDAGQSIAVDSSGFAYITGFTGSPTFPTSVNAFLRSHPYDQQPHAFVTKFDTTASSLVYSTYLAGISDNDPGSVGTAITIDASGSVYVTGYMSPANFPNGFDNAQGSPAFVTKLNSAGSALVYSTLLGGYSTFGSGIAVDSSGSAHVTGSTNSSTFPTTVNAFQRSPGGGGSYDAFLTKLNSTGSGISYSTLLGGDGTDLARAIALDSFGTAYIAGSTTSTNFPTVRAFQPNFTSSSDAFVARILPSDIPGLTLLALSPTQGGDTGSVSITVVGLGFVSGATVTLARPGSPDIVGVAPVVAFAGQQITATFDLRGKGRGVWDLVVTNPDSTSTRLSGAFTIEVGRAPQVSVDIVGPSVVRLGRVQQYSIVYTNRGNVDAENVPIWLSVPAGVTVKPKFPVAPPQSTAVPDWSQVPLQASSMTETRLSSSFQQSQPVPQVFSRSM